jgi:hypothetical protein
MVGGTLAVSLFGIAVALPRLLGQTMNSVQAISTFRWISAYELQFARYRQRTHRT